MTPDVLESNHRTLEERLASFRFFDLRCGVPTVAGLLLFGTNPLHFLPGARVTFLRFTGHAMTDRPADELSTSDNLPALADVVFVGRHANPLDPDRDERGFSIAGAVTG